MLASSSFRCYRLVQELAAGGGRGAHAVTSGRGSQGSEKWTLSTITMLVDGVHFVILSA
jgi:hypothetical protein